VVIMLVGIINGVAVNLYPEGETFSNLFFITNLAGTLIILLVPTIVIVFKEGIDIAIIVPFFLVSLAIVVALSIFPMILTALIIKALIYIF